MTFASASLKTWLRALWQLAYTIWMRSVTWNRFPIKKLWSIPCLYHLWSEATWIQISANLNHCKKRKAEPSRLILWKPTENLELLFGEYEYCKLLVSYVSTSSYSEKYLPSIK